MPQDSLQEGFEVVVRPAAVRVPRREYGVVGGCSFGSLDLCTYWYV